LVSIVTPTLNQGRLIEDTIRSVRAQTYTNIEHIVVDGGSTDGTIEILTRHERMGWLTWRSEPDRGMYEAVNKGFALAQGDVLAYLNSDDVYPPWAVDVAASAFDADPELDVVFGDGLAIDVESGRQRIAFVPPFHAPSLAHSGSLVQPAVFLRRRVMERHGGFDTTLRFAGDLEYWLRVGSNARFGRIDEVLAVERVHSDALSRASAGAMAVEVEGVRGRFRPSLTRSAWFLTTMARARAALWRRVLWLRFLRASRARRTPSGPWSRIHAEGNLEISPSRVVLAQVPRIGAPFAWNAVISMRDWFSTTKVPVAGSQGSAATTE
jgi:glycosyltransferase involved in cell wall biosynthesis